MKHLWRYLIMIALFSGISTTLVAQDDTDDICPPIITDAINLAGENCADLGRNSACYGHNQVVASFSAEDTAQAFSEPADVAPLADVISISTAALNADESIWGLALMNVQANIPDTIPGQAVLFFLMGETQIENRSTDAPAPIVPANITIVATGADRVNVRSGAGRNFNALGAVANNSTQVATGVSEDGEWVRVTFGDTDGWVSAILVQPTDSALFNTLPVVADEDAVLSPMQAFYFTTGTGNPTCRQAPDAIVIQSPERLSVNVTINGATVRIGSTIVLTTQLGETSPDDDLDDNCVLTEAIVLDGNIEANGGGLNIPLGHFATFTACEGEDGQIIPQDDWQAGGIVSEERLAEFGVLEQLPEGLLHYAIKIPTRAAIEEALRPTATPEPRPTTVVVATSTPARTGGVNCGGFSALSPTGQIIWGTQEFRWSPVVGADFYYFTLVRTDGRPGSVFISQVGGTAQSVFVDAGIGTLYQVGRSNNLDWQVEAWARDATGQPYKACSTALVPVRRSIPSFEQICQQLDGYKISDDRCVRNGTTGDEIFIPE